MRSWMGMYASPLSSIAIVEGYSILVLRQVQNVGLVGVKTHILFKIREIVFIVGLNFNHHLI